MTPVDETLKVRFLGTSMKSFLTDLPNLHASDVHGALVVAKVIKIVLLFALR